MKINMEEKTLRVWHVLLFIAVCFGWTWLCWISEIILGVKLHLGPNGPLIAALTLACITEKRMGLKRLLLSAIKYTADKRWLIPAVLLFPAIAGISFYITGLLGEDLPVSKVYGKPWAIPLNFITILFLGGPVQEEFGWRGFLLPELQKKYNALWSGIIVGIIWALWHFPLNFMADKAGPQYSAAIQMLIGSVLMMISLSVIFTFFWNNTGGSVMVALLLHTMLNLSVYIIFPVFETKTGPALLMLFLMIIAFTIVLIYGKKLISGENSQNPGK